MDRPVAQMSAFWLSDAGMSTRAIAPIVGTSQMQVSRDVRQVKPYVSPEPRGDSYPELVEGAETEPVEVYQSISRDAELIEPVKVTGMDGKEYTRPTPRIRG